MKTSEKIRKRIKDYNNTTSNEKSYFCNDNISQFIEDGETDQIIDEATEHIKKLLKSLVIDIDNDHNTKGTAHRVAKMFVNEVFSGRYKPCPDVTDFPNYANYDGIYVTGPITIKSTCAHHLQNITGKCWIGVKPGNEVIGLSKFNRLITWVAERPQIQEEMTVQIADLLQETTKTDDIAVIVKAEHHCMTHRGVKEHESDMTTSIMRGKFQTEQILRNEFLSLVNKMKGHTS